MQITDIHTHIVYGIDDGADDREMSLRLIDMEYNQGVRKIFCTSHSWSVKDCYQDYHRRFSGLKLEAEEKYPGLKLYKGCEVKCFRNEMEKTIDRIQEDIFPSMNGTRYVLAEFSPRVTDGMDEMRYCLIKLLNSGYIPIIAHAEKYHNIYSDPEEDIFFLRELGCMVQINLFSVQQDTGWRKELANLFLEKRLVDFVGTDAHNLSYKSAEAAIGAEAIRKRYGSAYADQILSGNAEKLLITDNPEMEG